MYLVDNTVAGFLFLNKCYYQTKSGEFHMHTDLVAVKLHYHCQDMEL